MLLSAFCIASLVLGSLEYTLIMSFIALMEPKMSAATPQKPIMIFFHRIQLNAPKPVSQCVMSSMKTCKKIVKF